MKLELFKRDSCPYCVKVMMLIDELGVGDQIEYCDISRDADARRRLLEVGAHCRPYNRCSIGVCYEGGLDAQGRPKDTRTEAQRHELLQLLIKLKRVFPKALIRGHSEMPGATPKACPCFSSRCYRYLDEVKIC